MHCVETMLFANQAFLQNHVTLAECLQRGGTIYAHAIPLSHYQHIQPKLSHILQICISIMQNMAVKFKSDKEKKDLAHTLKTRRKERGHTLKNVEKSLKINVGQLSRFEKGEFMTFSTNLQKYCSFLQIKINTSQSGLGSRLERFATRSPMHRAAAEEIINALEKLN